jgi:large subunit ribosomal protein L2
MLLKKIKPISNNTRHKIKISKNSLLKNNKLIKKLNVFLKKNSGRCSKTGQITVRHKGNGVKNLSRKITPTNKKHQTLTIGSNYDPKRASFLSLKFDLKKKEFLYDIALENEYPGTLLESNHEKSDLKLGFRNTLKKIPTGSIVSLVGEGKNGKAKYIKAAGNQGQIVNKTNLHAFVKLPSGKIKKFDINETAKIGAVSNQKHFLRVIGTAGVNRRLNKRPSVRGIAMNPVDHPHGGRTNGGRPSVTPWGLPTKCKFKLKKRKYE